MKFNIMCKSETGDRHKELNIQNQDAFFKSNDDVSCLCIADGAGSKKHSFLGASRIVKDIGIFLINNWRDLLTPSISDDDIKAQIAVLIDTSLKNTALKFNVNYNELSSTLMFVLTDSKNYLLGHLGDGVILAQRSETVNVLSFPHNGKTYQETYLTTMPKVGRFFNLRKEKCDTIQSFWLMTDGAMFKVFQDNFGLPENELSMQLIQKRLENGHKDDATYGYIAWDI